MKLNKKMLSNILFVVLIAALLYPNSRAFILRQLAFAPSVRTEAKSPTLKDYNWQLKGLNTADLNFKSLKNEVVFVNIWATWCPPCRAEMPLIQELYDDYKDKVHFVFVTSDNAQKVTAYYKEHNLDLPTYNMYSSAPKLFETRSIPATFIVSKKGKVVVSTTGAANWNSKKIRRLVDKLLAE